MKVSTDSAMRPLRRLYEKLVQPRAPHSVKTALRGVWLPVARASGYPVSSPRLPRPPLLHDRSPLLLSHALTACDLDADYLKYWPFTETSMVGDRRDRALARTHRRRERRSARASRGPVRGVVRSHPWCAHRSPSPVHPASLSGVDQDRRSGGDHRCRPLSPASLVLRRPDQVARLPVLRLVP